MQAAMQSGCESEHVVKVVETILPRTPNSSSVFIVMELCEGGNLRDWMRRVKANRLHSEIVSAPDTGKAARDAVQPAQVSASSDYMAPLTLDTCCCHGLCLFLATCPVLGMLVHVTGIC